MVNVEVQTPARWSDFVEPRLKYIEAQDLLDNHVGLLFLKKRRSYGRGAKSSRFSKETKSSRNSTARKSVSP
jgi:hypothetical protein